MNSQLSKTHLRNWFNHSVSEWLFAYHRKCIKIMILDVKLIFVVGFCLSQLVLNEISGRFTSCALLCFLCSDSFIKIFLLSDYTKENHMMHFNWDTNIYTVIYLLKSRLFLKRSTLPFRVKFIHSFVFQTAEKEGWQNANYIHNMINCWYYP